MIVVKVDDSVATALRRGHPWIFREALRGTTGGTPRTGDVVSVQDQRGGTIGLGLFDTSSPLAVRIYTRGADQPLDAAWFSQTIARAFSRRHQLAKSETNAYRLLNGEGDRVPGLVLDRYAHVAVLRTDGAAMQSWVPRLVETLLPLLSSIGVSSLLGRVEASAANDRRVVQLGGEAAPDTIDVLEHGMKMEVDLARGQKTGAFLDQRENRRRVRERSNGAKKVLNLYSYSGGFSLAAALGGAERTVSVDIAPKAHASAQRSFRKNGLDPSAHAFVTADVFAFLEGAAKSKERFDRIICDPPSFAPNERAKKTALAAYSKLHKACASLLAEGGMFAAASCSSHISAEDFLTTLTDEVLGRSDLSVREVYGPPEDHPSPATFPEGRYLKFIWLS